jgi:hypothetical protein
MSRLFPEFFAGKRIKFRIPYEMSGEVLVPSNGNGIAVPEEQFRHGIDKPFEIHSFKPQVTAFDDQNPAEIIDSVPPEVLESRIRLSMVDESKNIRLTKRPTLIRQLITENARTWDWPVPYTIILQEGFQVTCDADAYPTVCAPDANCDLVQTQIGTARVEATFSGYLIVLQPPDAGGPDLSAAEMAGLGGYMNYPPSR